MAIGQSMQINHLVGTIPIKEQNHWLLEAELVQLHWGKVVHELGEVPSYVYFPITAIASILLVTENGESIEIAQVGSEGMVGVAAFMGGGRSLWRFVVKHPGEALRLRASVFKNDFDQNSSIQHSMLQYAHALILQMGQTAGCARHHKVLARMSSWLLHFLDRVADNELVVTHDFIAQMLGVRREGITEAMLHLQSLGLVKSGRGRIVILNRHGLQKVACECYSTVKREYDSLSAKRLPPTKGSVQPTEIKQASDDNEFLSIY